MKQLKSSHQDLREFALRRITAQHIAESLTSFDSAADAQATKEILEQHSFDVAGARQDGQVVGFIRCPDLTGGQVGDHRIEFGEDDVLAASTPLVDVLKPIRGSGRVFVEVLGSVGGIITHGDLQKMPVRLWLFGLISLLEMQMLRLIREQFSNESWVDLLKPNRVEAAHRLFEMRTKRNLEIDLADCLQLCDKKDIFAATPILRELAGFDSKRRFRSTLGAIIELRDNLAHSQNILGGELKTFIELAMQLEALLLNLEREHH